MNSAYASFFGVAFFAAGFFGADSVFFGAAAGFFLATTATSATDSVHFSSATTASLATAAFFFTRSGNLPTLNVHKASTVARALFNLFGLPIIFERIFVHPTKSSTILTEEPAFKPVPGAAGISLTCAPLYLFAT